MFLERGTKLCHRTGAYKFDSVIDVKLDYYRFSDRLKAASLANPTCLQSFMVRYCSVCELYTHVEFKEEYWRISLSHARIYMISWSVVYFDEINDMKVSNLISY